ncbi:MAG: EAL domain-containing protein [Campylobacterota bacterium]|nr:EAL domain-containing protein [Campylobacterota bacterium]
MTLSKQLYIIISFIFFMIFTGNFIISVTNFKNYLIVESTTKSQDTATSLGMSLKSLIDDKTDSEIKSTIRAIANRGFYKEIRLEDVEFNFSKDDLIIKNSKLDDSYEIKNVRVDISDGEIISSSVDNELENELLKLEGETAIVNNNKIVYSFIASKNFPNNKMLTINYTAFNDTTSLDLSTQIEINKVLVQVVRKEKFEGIPQWFIDALPMKMVETKSEISNGWKTKAIIYVSANAGDAYAQLYEQAKGAIYYAMVSFLISIVILIFFLRFILKPLKDIESLAKDISQGRFKTIKKLPWTKELKNVSLSMNDMSSKIKNMISKLNKNLEKMTEQLSRDDLTGLQQEQTFNTDMKQMFIKKEDGYVFSVKIYHFGEFAKNHSNNVDNNFLKEFANILKNCDEDILTYRFYGSTFTMISKRTQYKDIEQIVLKLKQEFEKLSLKYELSSVAHIGATPFNPISTTEDILALANEAYEAAKQVGSNEFYIRDKSDLARDMQEWKELIFDIIDNNKFKVGYINQEISMSDNETVLLEEAFTSATDKNGKSIPIGTFVSVAEEYNKVIDFDKAVISKIIKYIKENNIKHQILINLAFDSLMDSDFKIWLENILIENKDISQQLAFSVTAYGCVRDIEAFKVFIELVHKNNAKVILKRFETKFIPLNSLKELNLDYIRLARDYTNGISTDKSKQSFVESVCELSKLLNIKVFAESVSDKDSFLKLKELGIYGASK